MESTRATETSLVASSWYFCSVCEKPFNEESSYARHVKYCRRRASNRQPLRQRACEACRKTKNKCDFKSPCSRCAAKHTPCSYVKGYYRASVPASASAPGPSRRGAIANPDPHDSPVSAAEPPSTAVVPTTSAVLSEPIVPPLDLAPETELGLDQLNQSLTQGPAPDNHTAENDALFNDSGGSSSLVQSSFAFTGDQYASMFYASQSAVVNLHLGRPISGGFRYADVTELDLLPSPDHHDGDVLLGLLPKRPTASDLVPRPHDSARLFDHGRVFPHDAHQPTPRTMSNGCRQLIVSILRTFPRMLVRAPTGLPPFIHPLGCGLHFAQGPDAGGLDDGWAAVQQFEAAPNGAGFIPLRPLAACIGVAHIFVARTANSDEFLWQTIEAEHRRIRAEMHQFTPGETLAATQAMMLYTTMRLMVSGYEYFQANRGGLMTLNDLSRRFSELCPGPFSPAHVRLHRPTWEEWIFEETRRRMAVVCFLMTLVVGSEACLAILDPPSLLLPSSRALWEAKDRWSWEREFDAAWAELGTVARHHQHAGPRLDTIGDLAVVKNGLSDPRFGAGRAGAAAAAASDVLDSWHAGLDGLGIMLAAVLADH
ncbi:hypothetical protein B0T26DRAFT_755704 [Lasiosphaeria miniovina]|uniref:Zn(2)-C6 fungal-type domain-containing protein n=1 Tax=Lasiosphaeria miniovina TaxID=1954250 RepID=A0AA39ZZC0_9PEZI|nr:uncharacterized protein B0T26DRAFT_755704 [Lasiosphaeria miniovina]KAK0706179.1 hypothetical protein B0T26DRAFT_755704 [Lasiosphaeria miniovina]